MKKIKSMKAFGGWTQFYEHQSEITKTPMKFSCLMPSQEKVENAIIWLSGLTCTEENFVVKAGAQRFLENKNLMIICPDTSPRGLELPGEHDSYDFGSGAGFYVNALTEGYKDHYRMFDYVKFEILEILKSKFDIKRVSIMGHSMGGHGALVLGLKEQDLFQSVSAFAPITNPLNCPWGQKAFQGYFGEEALREGAMFDATALVQAGQIRSDSILIDQGLEDEFLKEQLLPEEFKKACEASGQKLTLNYREGYDHSYYFISSFIEDHIQFHGDRLLGHSS